jgi:hypothetical protein
MLNPSTANAREDDATIRRCVAYSRVWGYDGLTVRNLYPLISTDPAGLWQHADPKGGTRGDRELKAARGGSLIIVAWGANAPAARAAEALSILQARGKQLHCLGLTKAGQPLHPLRLRNDLRPVCFRS